MKRRGFPGLLGGLAVVPFVKKEEVTIRGVPLVFEPMENEIRYDEVHFEHWLRAECKRTWPLCSVVSSVVQAGVFEAFSMGNSIVLPEKRAIFDVGEFFLENGLRLPEEMAAALVNPTITG